MYIGVFGLMGIIVGSALFGLAVGSVLAIASREDDEIDRLRAEEIMKKNINPGGKNE